MSRATATAAAGSPPEDSSSAGSSRWLLLAVEGMHCAGCATGIETALRAFPGVREARVSHPLERAEVDFEPGAEDLAGVVALVRERGYGVPVREVVLEIAGMSCAGCVASAEGALRRVPGVIGAEVNLALGQARAALAAGTPQALVAAIEGAGYRAQVRSGDATARAHEDRERGEAADRGDRRDLALLGLGALLTAPLLAQMVLMTLGLPWHLAPWWEVALAAPVQFVVGARFYRGAWQAIRNRSGNMDLLVAMGTSAAFFYSLVLVILQGEAVAGALYFEASAVIITLVFAGKWLEDQARRGTTAAIRELMRLRPERARVERDGVEEEVAVDAVARGDVVVVRPGERVPVDGRVVEGESEVDEALITGESLPVARVAGDRVPAGAVNGTGLLRLEAVAVGEDSTLSRIIRLVESAQSGKAPVQRLVDRVSAVFVPVVIVISALAFTGWLLAGGTFEQALVAAVSVLVIACPCALGLATPTAIVTGTGAAARAGILVRSVESLERAHGIDVVVFDKTGTLTEGRPVVSAVEATEGEGTALLRVAAAVQAGSEHPLARAVLEAAREAGIEAPRATEFRSHTGAGASARVDGEVVVLGTSRLLEGRGIDVAPLAARQQVLEAGGASVMLVARGERVRGLIAVEDRIRPEAREAVADLRSAGIHTLLLSGDATAVAERVAREIGLDEWRAPVAPGDKAAVIEALRADGRRVAMVGDGINDAPALAAADLGIAMGSGTDVAMETAGVTLMRPDPRLVAAALGVSRATRRKVIQNLFWAFVYNVLALPLAAFGMLSPAVAGAAMAASSLSVVGNSLLLRRWRPRR